MDPAREIIHMLMLRRREMQRARKRVDRAVTEPTRAAFIDGQCIEATLTCDIARKMYHMSIGGSPQAQEERRRVIAISIGRDEFVSLSDGYVHFWPDGSPHGALTSWHLRTIADELDRRNRAWDAKVRKALDNQDETDLI
jgi:hypothetical protein